MKLQAAKAPNFHFCCPAFLLVKAAGFSQLTLNKSDLAVPDERQEKSSPLIASYSSRPLGRRNSKAGSD